MINRLTALGAALLLALAGAFALTSPAQADGAAPGHVTGFDGALYSTAIVDINPAFWDSGDCIEIDSSLDNRIGSLVNSSNTTDFTAYGNDACAPGQTLFVGHNTAFALGSVWNNNIESFRRSWSN